jgi:hypothetical protein
MTVRNASGSSTASRRSTWISGSLLFHFDSSELHLILPQLEITIAANKPLKSIELLIDKEHKDVTWEPSSEQKFWNAKFNPPL